ncbi:hypothetical protein HPB49_022152 [Dermacentor silvarum]|uniref:Uncharacterized protein n=1 Tax=Dermacentor silvarum TaxID=543639 RepID=A0ACB8DG18_DERSI|nr:hypothetical protein HPB49_022152 [Dermacentor silvarum]
MNQYLQQIDEALQQGRGKKAAELLSCKHAHSASSRLQVEDPEPAVQRVMDAPWDEVVCQHLRCLYHMNNYSFVDAYKEQAVLVQYPLLIVRMTAPAFSGRKLFTKIFQSLKEENWALPIMYTVCLDLRLFASQADMQLSKKSKGKPGETLEKAAEFLMGCFRVCASDNRSSLENSKRRGMLNLVNQLFKIYFKINKLHLCKPLIRAIESSALKDHFSISQLVTYRYYVGQKAMFDSDFKNAAPGKSKRTASKSFKVSRRFLIGSARHVTVRGSGLVSRAVALSNRRKGRLLAATVARIASLTALRSRFRVFSSRRGVV